MDKSDLPRMPLLQLLDLWGKTTTNNSPYIYTVRGWLMEELEKREPDRFNKWMDADAPEDDDLLRFMTANTMCLNCSRFCRGCKGTQETVWSGCAMKEDK